MLKIYFWVSALRFTDNHVTRRNFRSFGETLGAFGETGGSQLRFFDWCAQASSARQSVGFYDSESLTFANYPQICAERSPAGGG